MSIESRRHQYGTVFGHWQIGELLGASKNGQTAVFHLQHKESSQEESAVKVITLIEEQGKLREFSPRRKAEYETELEKRKQHALNEVQIMYVLKGYTNIVSYEDRVTEHWTENNSFGCDLLIRMELLRDLRKIMQGEHFFSEAEIVKIGKDICNALILCHGEKEPIIHRDIKPENIFVNARGDYKLGDFGISRIIEACPGASATTGIGTPEYAAPEQNRGRYDVRVDIYSLGLVLYELSNQNRRPFMESTYDNGGKANLLRLSGTKFPPPCDASDEFAKVILKACAFKPHNRYPSAQSMLDALKQISNTKPEPQRKKGFQLWKGKGTPLSIATAPNRQSNDSIGAYHTRSAEGESKSEPKQAYQTIPADSAAKQSHPANPGFYETLPAESISNAPGASKPHITEGVEIETHVIDINHEYITVELMTWEDKSAVPKAADQQHGEKQISLTSPSDQKPPKTATSNTSTTLSSVGKQSTSHFSENSFVGFEGSFAKAPKGVITEPTKPQINKTAAPPQPEFVIKGTTLMRYKGVDQDVVIPDGVTTIAFRAFYMNNIIRKVTMPSTLVSIEMEAFSHCSQLSSVVFNDKLWQITIKAFSDCTSLKKLHLGKSVHVLGIESFANCVNLEEVWLPPDLPVLHEKVFVGCDRIQTVTIPKGTISIADNAFPTTVRIITE